ncbi:hypothetical protein [Leisingera sp. ANG-S5]|uniref:hypothetical protein n=1 Tax=Leisingera sp. ANG-S5 TaxID=1577901 RepID=UPI000B122B20|nr:hypothetical protein [Leisingera sp. ANG-S5]
MQRFTSWAEIEPTATKAEIELKHAASTGIICKTGPRNEIPPLHNGWTGINRDRVIRAGVLRFFLEKEGKSSNYKREIKVIGAYISQELDLTEAEIQRSLTLCDCRLFSGIVAERSFWRNPVHIVNCAVPGLNFAEAEFRSQVVLESLNLKSARPSPLNFQGARFGSDCFLSSVKVKGHSNFVGSRVSGQLSICGSSFIYSKKNDVALDMQDSRINSNLFLDGQTTFIGGLDLTAAFIRDLVDNEVDWKTACQGPLNINGFKYSIIHGATDSTSRLEWLNLGERHQQDFHPQPYKQLAKTLHDMGHEADAKKVRIALARKLTIQTRARRTVILDGTGAAAWLSLWYDFTNPFLWIWHNTLGLLTDHGFRPGKSVAALVALWVLAVCPAHLAWEEGSFAPNSGPILTSPEWKALARTDPNPAQAWGQSVPGKDWESFDKYAYAADLVIPILDLGQTDAWAPSTERGWWGKQLWWLRWVFTTLGWIVTALGAAALTGIIRRE